MGKSKAKAKDIEVKEPEVVKIPRTKETLLQDVQIGEVLYKKGDKYPLTEAGKKYFKSLNYIK